jgi:hypothetical protein
MLEDLEDMFPNLYGSSYQITSPVSLEYNCVAWALGITNQWWSHDGTWPDSVPRSPYIRALTQVFELFGYEICDSGENETGYDKVALYALDGEWRHAARQLEDGRWTSKLGPFEDITHLSLQDLAGELYGSVHCIMRRPFSVP